MGATRRVWLTPQVMNRNRSPYIPALKYGWLTALYDPVLRVTLREQTFKVQLIEQAGVKQGHNILDLGCGTATLTLLTKKLHPETQVVGLDADLKAFEIAKGKAVQSRTSGVPWKKHLGFCGQRGSFMSPTGERSKIF